MSDPLTLGLVAGGSSLLGSLANTASQIWANFRNEGLMREAWGREDTAIQRRVADLKAAGLSPVLAAGQGASSSPAITLRAPQTDAGEAVSKGLEGAVTALAMMKQKEDISKTQAETDRLVAETDYLRSQLTGQNLKNELSAGTVKALIATANEEALTAFSERRLKAYQANAEALHVTEEELKVAHDRAAQEQGWPDLSETAQKIAELKIAIEGKKWDVERAKGSGLPVGSTGGMVGTIPMMGGAAIGALLEQVAKMLRGGK